MGTRENKNAKIANLRNPRKIKPAKIRARTVMHAWNCHEKFGPGPKVVRPDRFWSAISGPTVRKLVRYHSLG